jgi:citrate lyase subunit beta/citryl-CoA lyase
MSFAEGRAGVPHGSVSIVALPETASALCDIRELARASRRVRSILSAITDRAEDDVVFHGDASGAAGFLPTHEGLEQLFLASKVCLESRAGGAPFPLATIMGTRIGDDEATRRIARRSREAGFTGCVCIHPSQVPVVNELFRPSSREYAFALGVLDAMEKAREQGLWAVNFRGIMIDQASVEAARNTVQEARRRGVSLPGNPP